METALKIMVDRDGLFSVVQAAISIIVVLGGGATLIFRPEMSDTVVPLITLVLGFYFSSASLQRGVVIGQNSQQIQAPFSKP